MLDTKDCSDFVRFLERRLGLTGSDIPSACSWAGTGNTLGSIGLRVGLLSLDEIDQIISKQSADERRFGEIAVEAEFLTPAQVDLLLQMQHFHRCLDTSAPLVLEGRVEFGELLGLMASYFDGFIGANDGSAAEVSES